MNNKIGRNDTCPCMSDMKYKNCCDKTGIWVYFKEQGLSYVNEKYYLSDIEQDKKFVNLYNNDRDKINKTVFFLKSDTNLKARMSYGNVGDDAYIIVSRFSKIPIEESIHVAHELEHIVLHSKGHKAVFYKDEALNYSLRMQKMLNDMIYDPIVNKRLIEFGYDMVSYLKLSDSIQMNLTKSEENLFLVKTLYVKRILDFRNIKPDIENNKIDFVIWAEKYFPEVVEDSKELLKIIEKDGISSPIETEASLNDVIKYLNLGSKLKVKRF